MVEDIDSEIRVISNNLDNNHRSIFKLKSKIAVPLAFIGLIVSTSLYVALTIYFQSKVNINVFGFTSLEQMLLPFFLIPFSWLVNRFKPLR